MTNVLTVDELVGRILEREEEDGVEEARKLYSKIMDNSRLNEYKEDVDASLLLAGKDDLIVEKY